MERLVEDLMSLSRIEADKYRLPAEAVTAPRLVYIPQHRQKLVGQMRDRLRGIRVILSSEPLRASLSRLCPEVPTLVLRDGVPATGLARGLGLPMASPSACGTSAVSP